MPVISRRSEPCRFLLYLWGLHLYHLVTAAAMLERGDGLAPLRSTDLSHITESQVSNSTTWGNYIDIPLIPSVALGMDWCDYVTAMGMNEGEGGSSPQHSFSGLFS